MHMRKCITLLIIYLFSWFILCQIVAWGYFGTYTETNSLEIFGNGFDGEKF